MRIVPLLLFWFAALPALAAPQMAIKTADMRQAIDDLTLAAANHGMQLVKVQPIDKALVKRGFEDPHVRILFIGSETAVRWAEAADARLLNLLPLRLTLVQRGEQIVVMSDDLEPWKGQFPEGPAHRVLLGWEVELKEVLADFASQ
ncbi:MAG TPA: hypothetical protein PLW81_04630 [Thiobacillaceae bacterium]|nr:hypothetical protein [Thiobacillaceae bacterium]